MGTACHLPRSLLRHVDIPRTHASASRPQHYRAECQVEDVPDADENVGRFRHYLFGALAGHDPLPWGPNQFALELELAAQFYVEPLFIDLDKRNLLRLGTFLPHFFCRQLDSSVRLSSSFVSSPSDAQAPSSTAQQYAYSFQLPSSAEEADAYEMETGLGEIDDEEESDAGDV